jgi:hypothetical protein
MNETLPMIGCLTVLRKRSNPNLGFSASLGGLPAAEGEYSKRVSHPDIVIIFLAMKDFTANAC